MESNSMQNGNEPQTTHLSDILIAQREAAPLIDEPGEETIIYITKAA